MSALNREAHAIQNPALGSVLLWRFACGYYEGGGNAASTPAPLLFIVLPIILHGEIFDVVSSTYKKSGLRKFTEKFSASATSKSDLLLSVQARASAMRQLTLDSLRLAMSANLLSLDAEAGSVFPVTRAAPKAGIPESVRPMLDGASKLGFWLSEVSLYEAGIVLKVAF